MDGASLFWLALLFALLYPAWQQRRMARLRLQGIRRLELLRRSRVVLLVHRQEQLGLLGLPFFRFINIHDSERIVRALRMTDPGMPIDLVLHTPGGLQLAALQIADAVYHRKGRVTVLVPHYAMSGGTLIALAADEILMDPHAVLGPIDPQIGPWPAASVVRAIRSKGVSRARDETLILGDVAGKALVQTRGAVRRLLSKRMPEEQADERAALLTEGGWTHDHPITCAEASALGLPVRCAVPREVYELMELFPQPTRRPAVAFIPRPYGPG